MKGQICALNLDILFFYASQARVEEGQRNCRILQQTIESADEHDTEDDDKDGDDDVDYEVDDDERLMARDCRDGQQDAWMADEQSP